MPQPCFTGQKGRCWGFDAKFFVRVPAKDLSMHAERQRSLFTAFLSLRLLLPICVQLLSRVLQMVQQDP